MANHPIWISPARLEACGKAVNALADLIEFASVNPRFFPARQYQALRDLDAFITPLAESILKAFNNERDARDNDQENKSAEYPVQPDGATDTKAGSTTL